MRPATRPDGVPIFDVARALALYPAVPPDLVQGLGRFFNLRIRTGAFLHAVLCNDLQESVVRAAPESLAALPHLVKLLFDYAPPYGWGTDAAVGGWLKGRTEAAPMGSGERSWPITADGRPAPDYFCSGAPTVEACTDAHRCLRDPVCNE